MNDPKNCSEGFYRAFRRDISMPGKITLFTGAVLILISAFVSCGPAADEKQHLEDSQIIAAKVNEYAKGLATDTINGVTHNFVRSADMKFKVKNVLECSNRIEDLITKKGGYISLSDLSSQINYSNSIKFKEDSLMESTYYTTLNSITLKIPNKQLDTVLREISSMAMFINYRKLRADDVKMSLYANSLTEKRYETFNKELKKDVVKNKINLDHSIKAQEKLLEKQTASDNASMDSYDLADKVNYSTLVLELYQTEQVQTEVVGVPPAVEPYKPSFLSQLKNSLVSGFDILKNCFLFIVNSWGLIVFFLIVLFTFKKLKVFITQKLFSSERYTDKI